MMYGLHCQHPYRFVRDVVVRRSAIPRATIQLVAYNLDSATDYGNRSWALWQLPAVELTEDKINSVIHSVSLSPNAEMGVASQIRLNSGFPAFEYLPYIDFIGRPDIGSLRQTCDDIAREFAISNYELYDSGNSYHAYFDAVMDPERYRAFVTRLSYRSYVDHVWLQYLPYQPHGQVLRWTAMSGHKSIINKVNI